MSGVDPQVPDRSFEGERRTYDVGELNEHEVDPDPFLQLRRWLDEADAAGMFEPTAMTVSTRGSEERLHSRTVLCRQLTSSGIVFYTNRDSAKGEELAAHPECAAQFLWLEMARQVRIEGVAVLLDDPEADAYFAGRPRGSQLGAWASPQSQVLRDRAELEARVAEVEERFAGVDVVPRPPHWGGYRIEPDYFEFWQGRPSRLHDRLRYRLDLHGHWKLDRLAP